MEPTLQGGFLAKWDPSFHHPKKGHDRRMAMFGGIFRCVILETSQLGHLKLEDTRD